MDFLHAANSLGANGSPFEDTREFCFAQKLSMDGPIEKESKKLIFSPASKSTAGFRQRFFHKTHSGSEPGNEKLRPPFYKLQFRFLGQFAHRAFVHAAYRVVLPVGTMASAYGIRTRVLSCEL